ncbi:alpha/beta fold hydrolase [Paucibacter sp. O1-1]|nr:alpha/beta fold hydrolase [Paucibacter sp. O1-1]MDA3825463.1 alpha/beta fold hydrolase [Paucibacter sp. O1-1]
MTAAGALLCAACLMACGGGGDTRSLVNNNDVATPASIKAAARTERFTYLMPAVRGGHTRTDALLFTPTGAPPAGGWPLAVWAHGTTGVADACAPSVDTDWGDVEKPVNALLRAGFAVLAPDYEGLGGPGVHPYYSLSSHGLSIVEAVRGAHDFASARLSADWVVIGHSQGGHAAMAAAQHASRLEARHRLRAVAVLAPGTDVAASLQDLFGMIDSLEQAGQTDAAGAAAYSLAFNGTMVAYGMQAQDAALAPSLLLRPEFEALAAQALTVNRCNDFGDAVGQALFEHINSGRPVANFPAIRRDALSQPALRRALDRNRPGMVKLAAPVLYLQGAQDLQTPAVTARKQVELMRSVGTEVSYVEAADADHEAIAKGTHLDAAIAFLRERMKPQ